MLWHRMYAYIGEGEFGWGRNERKKKRDPRKNKKQKKTFRLVCLAGAFALQRNEGNKNNSVA